MSSVNEEQLQYSIKVYKQYFNFASSHFLIFKDGTREPLHGHNYRVQLKGEACELDADMVFDFLDIKPIVREVCDSLDHKLLLPGENKLLQIEKRETSLHVQTPDGDQFVFPEKDVLILPLPNTSAERLAIYLAHEIHGLVRERFNFSFPKLEIEVEETPGQCAVYQFEA
jgi:6-pyruvoyltetrahydropterin/6-carboxytetrahydropterin synthase